jgi:hypothetical protein
MLQLCLQDTLRPHRAKRMSAAVCLPAAQGSAQAKAAASSGRHADRQRSNGCVSRQCSAAVAPRCSKHVKALPMPNYECCSDTIVQTP